MEHPKNKLAKSIALRNIKSAVLECSETFQRVSGAGLMGFRESEVLRGHI